MSTYKRRNREFEDRIAALVRAKTCTREGDHVCCVNGPCNGYPRGLVSPVRYRITDTFPNFWTAFYCTIIAVAMFVAGWFARGL